MSKKLVAIVGAACLGVSFVAGYMVGKDDYTPKAAYQAELNRDGNLDLTVELKNGKKVDLYNTRVDNDDEFYPNPTYLPHSKFKR